MHFRCFTVSWRASSVVYVCRIEISDSTFSLSNKSYNAIISKDVTSSCECRKTFDLRFSFIWSSQRLSVSLMTSSCFIWTLFGDRKMCAAQWWHVNSIKSDVSGGCVSKIWIEEKTKKLINLSLLLFLFCVAFRVFYCRIIYSLVKCRWLVTSVKWIAKSLLVIRWRKMITTLNCFVTKHACIEQILTIKWDIENKLSQWVLVRSFQFRWRERCWNINESSRHVIVSERRQHFEKWKIYIEIITVRCYHLCCLINFIRISCVDGTDCDRREGEFLIMEIRIESW